MPAEPLRATVAARRLGLPTSELLRLIHDRKIGYVMVDGIARPSRRHRRVPSPVGLVARPGCRHDPTMAQRNRVAPTGEIVATGLRCDWMGNRGCLHEGETIVRPWRSKAWITCRTDFRGRRVEQWAPGRYTVLFFHDEAVALAAGHRPCAECRRPDYRRFLDAWEQAHGQRPLANELDAILHSARVDGSRHSTHRMRWAEVPDGAFVTTASGPALVSGTMLLTWTVEHGYSARQPRPEAGDVSVLTPEPTVRVLQAGYQPALSGQVARD